MSHRGAASRHLQRLLHRLRLPRKQRWAEHAGGEEAPVGWRDECARSDCTIEQLAIALPPVLLQVLAAAYWGWDLEHDGLLHALRAWGVCGVEPHLRHHPVWDCGG